MTYEFLAYLWFAIILFEVAYYVLLDGADLGVGILSLFSRDERHRSRLMRPLGPVWTANETWLVVAGATLFGAFPTAFSIALSALYIPVMVLVFGLMLRAAAFELHEFSSGKHFWGLVFGVGSLCATLGQGFLAGGLLRGVVVEDLRFAGGVYDWVSLTTIAIALALVLVYMAIGYALFLKHDHGVRGWYVASIAGVLALLGGVVLFVFPYIIPGVVTITEAAAAPKTLEFMLFGIAPLVPAFAAYHIYLITIFRGNRAAYH